MKLSPQNLLATLVLTSTPAFAQNFSPTVSDLNTIFDPPMNIQGMICVQMDEGQKSVCKDGAAAARWMAEKYAKNAGSYLGCLDGFSQGLNLGFHAGKNPTAEMTQYAATFTAGAKFTSAEERAKAQARGEGQTISADQIIARYRAVIGKRDALGRPLLPNKSYELPEITFKGFDGGYDYDFTQRDANYSAVYQSGWVTTASAWDDRVAAAKLYSLQGSYANQMCRNDDTIFGRRQMPALTIWDIFRSYGKFNFETYGWNNADWAWDVLNNYEKTLDQYVTYTEIEKQTKQITVEVPIKETRPKLDSLGKAIPKLDSTGKPVVDSFGRPVYETEEVVIGKRNEIRTVALTTAEKDALRNAYMIGFKESYSRYYARQYASQNYHSVGMDKYKIGIEMGKLVGAEVAQKTALRLAYDAAYKNTSLGVYASEAHEKYKASFNYLMQIFAQNPVLEMNQAMVLGQTNDGIFRAGEELKVQFTATNLGEVSRPATFSILNSDKIIPSVSGFSFSVPALGSADFISSTLGRVSDSVFAQNSLNVTFGLQNPGDLKEVAKSLIVQKNEMILINDYLEVKRTIPSLDYLSGTFMAKIDVMNPANHFAPLTVSKVELNLGNAGIKQSDVLQLPGGGINNLSLSVEAIDPMTIIQAGGVNGSVNTYVAGRLAHSVPVAAQVNENQALAFVRYFDALATRKSTNTGKEALKDRLAKLVMGFNARVKSDVAQNVLWKRDSEVQGTLIAVIQRVYRESSLANRIDPFAQACYNELGKTLADLRDEVKAGGGLRLNRNANRNDFIDQIKKFAKI